MGTRGELPRLPSDADTLPCTCTCSGFNPAGRPCLRDRGRGPLQPRPHLSCDVLNECAVGLEAFIFITWETWVKSTSSIEFPGPKSRATHKNYFKSTSWTKLGVMPARLADVIKKALRTETMDFPSFPSRGWQLLPAPHVSTWRSSPRIKTQVHTSSPRPHPQETATFVTGECREGSA